MENVENHDEIEVPVVNDNGIMFDAASMAVDDNAERDGIIFSWGGIDFRISHHMNEEYTDYLQKLYKDNAHALRLDDGNARKLRKRLQCRAMARFIVRWWGSGLGYNGKPITWEASAEPRGSKKYVGPTAKSSQKLIEDMLFDPKMRLFKEFVMVSSMEDARFGVTSSEDDEKNS
jgi:hypothetical protein